MNRNDIVTELKVRAKVGDGSIEQAHVSMAEFRDDAAKMRQIAYDKGANFTQTTISIFSGTSKNVNVSPASIAGKELIAQIAAASNRSWFINKSGQVYACGINDSLGFASVAGPYNNQNPPALVNSFPGGTCVTNVVASETHTLFLTRSGQVYGCGDNEHGQLGIGEDKLRQLTPKRQTFFPANTMISQVATGMHHSLFLTSKGEVYLSGIPYSQYGGSYQCSESPYHPHPVLVLGFPVNTEITQVAAGTHHSLFLSRAGQVYVMGDNGCGQLGQDKAPYALNPTLLNGFRAKTMIVQVAANHDTSMFLTKTGEVYLCGYHGFIAPGHELGDANHCLYKPVLLTGFPDNTRICKIVLGYANAYFITDTGKVYGCGYSGALCLGQQTKDQLTPVLIRGFPSDVTICDIAIGSSTHTLFLSTTGEVYGCGIDHVSNLCLPNDVDTSMVQRLPR